MNQTTYPGTMAAHADSLQFMQKILQVDTTLSADPFAALGLSNDLLSFATTLGSHSWYVAKAHERIGASYYYLDDLDKSNTHYYKALLLFDSLGDLSGEALTLNNLGWNYRVQEKNDLAISCFLRSLEIYEQRGDWEHVQGVLNNLGTAYRREPGMEKEALEVYKKSLKINQNTGNRTWEAYNYNNIGLIHLDIKEYDSAIYYFQKAALENQDMGNQEQYCLNQLNLGLAFLEKDMLDSAEVYFQISKSILDEHDFPKTAYVYDDYQYALQLKKKNYQAALDFFIRKTAYEQEQQRQESEDIIARQRIKYEASKKEQELQIARKQMALQENLVIIMLLGSVIVLLIVLYNRKTAWTNQNKRLNKELNNKVIELKRINDENDRIKSNLEKLVREETNQILKKNERLRKYAFINSHKIRAPLARILGLIQVINLEQHEVINHEAFKKLNDSSAELDEVIRDINRVLLDEDDSHE